MERPHFVKLGDVYLNPMNITHVTVSTNPCQLIAFIVGREEPFTFDYECEADLRMTLFDLVTGNDERYFPIGEISVRARKHLIRAEVHTVDDVIRLGRNWLLSQKQVGGNTVKQIDALMQEFGHTKDWLES